MSWASLQDINMNYKKYRIFYHILFWLSYLVLYSFSTSLFYEKYTFVRMLEQYALTMVVDIFATYFTVYYLIPHFLLRKKYWQFILIFLLSAFGFVLCTRSIIYFITYPLFYPGEWGKVVFFEFNYLYVFLTIYSVVAIVAVIKMAKYWFEQQQRNQKLQQEKLQSELNFLKAQIHPHFLFNTLNNLYALTLDKSDQAPEVVVKLSGLLDYMLYQCNDAYVKLSKEINLIKDYLALEKIRYKKTLNIDLRIIGNPDNVKIAPLLLLPFVENSFKHGLSKVSQDPRVKVELIIENNHLIFKVENNKVNDIKNNQEDYTSGIGLKNVKRRLELIYPDRHELYILDKKNTFKTELKILLNNTQEK